MKKYIDIHSHIIFGADDGAESLTEAVELLKRDRDEGAYAVFATPHYGRENGFVPDAGLVLRNFQLLKERAAEEVPEVKVYLGTEWYCAWELGSRVLRRDAFRMNDTDYVLAEFLEYGQVHDRGRRSPATWRNCGSGDSDRCWRIRSGTGLCRKNGNGYGPCMRTGSSCR